jgi:hypothetical protein
LFRPGYLGHGFPTGRVWVQLYIDIVQYAGGQRENGGLKLTQTELLSILQM